MRWFAALAALAGLATLVCQGMDGRAFAQAVDPLAPAIESPAIELPGEGAAAPASPPEGQGGVRLEALFGAEGTPVRSGLLWRVFSAEANHEGIYSLLRQSDEASPLLMLPYGDYVVHVAWGLAGAVQRIAVAGQLQRVTLPINAGALRIVGRLDDNEIPPQRLRIAIYIPDQNDPEARLIARDVRAGQEVGLPEGTYHIVSTLLDTGRGSRMVDPGQARETNSVVSADVRIRAGQLTEATLRHRAATLTFKLVHTQGGEALANTNFTVLTPGGDVIGELIGAFPSMALAEGEYVAIARHDGRTYQSTFRVASGVDRDVEILTR